MRVEVRYRGRVQGVGFRAAVEHLARDFLVAGWVRNEEDGGVSLAAEGDPGEINRFLESIQARMGRHITSTERSETAPRGESGFEIRR